MSAAARPPAHPADPLEAGSPLRTPRAAAFAGIIFAVFTAAVLVILRLSTPAHPASPGQWLSDPAKRTAINAALNLVPFAGIAFLWFVGVLRDRIGGREDRFFATVFLGSGLLFIAMFFVAAGVAGGLVDVALAHPGAPAGSATLALGRNSTSILLNTYAVRMAAVFTLTTVTIARRTDFVPRWLWVAGLVTALVLLIGSNVSPWSELLFPAWILALSIDILVRPAGSRGTSQPEAGQPGAG
ncbi:MAG TPA: hypothetical protein VGG35_11315 [Streptosporangiaceae bacterium]